MAQRRSAITALRSRSGGGVHTTLPEQMRGSTVTTSLADIVTFRRAAMEMIAEAWGVLAAGHVAVFPAPRPKLR
jgi:hypothetical protein